jgi:hypothetical protein
MAAVLPETTRHFLVDFGLVKAEPLTPGQPWMIYIQASTPGVDYDGERVLPQAMQDARPYFLANGRISYEHITPDTRHDPSVLIGEPREMTITPDGRTLVKAELYQRVKKAQEVWDILQSGGKMKASVGGSILRRQQDVTGTPVVTKLFLNHIALTPWPVNDDTNVQLTPYDSFMKALGYRVHKALGATTGTSAQPLVMQDLEGQRQRLTPAFATRWQALTDIIQQLSQERGKALSDDDARQCALAVLIRRGEARQAYVAASGNRLPGSV